MRPAGSSGWRHRSARSARVLSRSDPTSSCARRRGSDRLWTRCRASELPPATAWEVTPACAARGSRGTSSAMPLEHLAVTDPRCNDRHHRCLGATPAAAPSHRAVATPPRFLQTGRTAGTSPFPAAATCVAQSLNWYRANLAPRMPGSPPTLPPVEAPTLGIWSTNDHYLDGERMKMSGRFLKASWRYEEIDGASHWIPLDASDQLNQLLIEWLD